jgi:hypothetical protein
MSDVVEFLESMGRDASLLASSPGKVEFALQSSGIAGELKAAIVRGDAMALRFLLQISPQCAWLVPGEEQQEDESEGEAEEDDDEPKEAVSSRRLSSASAE